MSKIGLTVLIIMQKPNIQKVLIGNKIDLVDDRKISNEEAQNLADEHNIPYFETSAKLDKNVSEVA